MNLKMENMVLRFTVFEQPKTLPWTHRKQRVAYAMWGFLNPKMMVWFLEFFPGSCKLRETKETHIYFLSGLFF